MLDQELRTLRDDINRSVPAAPFDTLVARGRRRRRRTGAGIAALALLAGGIAVGAGQIVEHDASTPPADSPDVPIRTADQLIDGDGATVWWYETPQEGLEYAVWGEACDESCPLALTWTSDNWATRDSYLMPTWGDVWWVGDKFLVWEGDDVAYLLNRDTTRIPVGPPGAARPAKPGEIVIGVGDERINPVLLDTETGQTHRILIPGTVTPRQVEAREDGSLWMLGARPDGEGVFATSTDGGVTWDQDSVPVTPDAAWFTEDATHVAIKKQGLAGLELTVSSDSGRTWTQAKDLPFKSGNCYTTASGLLFVSHGTQLFRSTDDSWLTFEELPAAPPLQCVSSTADGVLSATGANKTTGLVSDDLGETWTALDPR